MRIAVIGAGISGLGAAWLLSRRHDVTVYEKEPALGGHSNTVDVACGHDTIPIDTGFIVYNTASYPNLIALFDHLGVPTATTSMSFAVSCAGGRYEYSGSDLNGFFGQRSNIVSLRHWLMASDIFRFFREARQLIDDGADQEQSLGDWLETRRYSTVFIRRHILPMGAAIWSTPASEMLDFPAVSFARFFANHGLLQATRRPAWRTVAGGSREYVKRLAAALPGPVRLAEPALQIKRDAQGVRVTSAKGTEDSFDACLLATHADVALRTLAEPDGEEQRLLGAFRYARNEAVLHTDPGFMPRRKRVWSAWNYLSSGDGDRLSVTYWMNRLQPLATKQDYFVTLNPHRPIAASRVVQRFVYHHPIFDSGAMCAQRQLWALQGRRRTWFAGSYFGHGFHEDGLQAGLAAAESLGDVRRPWTVAGESGRIHIARAAEPAAFVMAAQ